MLFSRLIRSSPNRRPSRLCFLAALVLGVAGSAAPAHAGGWHEMHQTSNDVRLAIGPDGIATVQHHLRYRIVAGHFDSFDLVGVEPLGELSTEAVLTPEQGGAEVLARIEPVPKTPGTLRILIDEGKGLGRGAYVVDVTYRLDLVATNMLTRDGAMWKVAWTAPPAPEGHDGARVIFDLPRAPTEPRLAAAAQSTTTLATLRRGAERDELELVRAHVPVGEAVTWAARVDPKAFPRVTAPELRRPVPVPGAPPSVIGSNLKRVLVACGFALLAGALTALLREKQRAVRAAAALRSAKARPLIALPWGLSAFAYGIVTSLALATLLWSRPLLGASLVAVAMALGVHRSPIPIVRPRRPGAWRLLSDPKALLAERAAALPTDTLDVSTTRGRSLFAVIALLVVALAWLLRARVPGVAIALPLTSAVLVPIFVTGTRGQMVPTPTELGARILRPARDALASTIDLAHVDLATIGRVIADNHTVDEVRLACAPKGRTPGLRAIELALATSAGGHAAIPEVFVRFDDGSEAAERIAPLIAGAPVVVGRAPEEKVVRLCVDEPTPAASAALVAKLVLALEGRRMSDRPGQADPARARRAGPSGRARWNGKERRRRVLARSGLRHATPAPTAS